MILFMFCLLIQTKPQVALVPVESWTVEIEWHPEVLMDVLPGDGFLIGCPDQNAVWVLDGKGEILIKKGFNDSGSKLVNFKALANGEIVIYLMDALSRSRWVRFDDSFAEMGSGEFKPELTIHPFPMFSDDARWFLSPNFAIYDPGLPQRLVGQGIFTIDGGEVETFSQHEEGGRLYSQMTVDSLYELVKERTKGFFQLHALLNFDMEGRVLVGKSHAGEVLRWDPKTKTTQTLFNFQPVESSKTQRREVAKRILKDRILTRMPIDLGEKKEGLLDRIMAEPQGEFQNPQCWGVFQFTSNVYGVVTSLDFETGDQICELFAGDGHPVGTVSASHWGFLSPKLAPKLRVFDGGIYRTQPSTKGRRLVIVRSKLAR